MPALHGERLFTFEEGEQESEYGYVRKVPTTTVPPNPSSYIDHPLLSLPLVEF